MQCIQYCRLLCRNKVKNIHSLNPEEIKPIYLFLTGGGGSGKSDLVKTIYHTLVKTFRRIVNNPELPTVLLMAPTGVYLPSTSKERL